jgi:glycosyltransferase involved in cell wall biosynthesis
LKLSNPTVSIIIPAYNVAPYIGDTLRSVLAQSFTDYEAIVINDGSTDETEAALEPFRARIVYVRQENRGVSAARNAALRVARGRFIALLDGDDIWLPDYLAHMAARLEADPGIDVLYPNAVFFGSPRWEGQLFMQVYPSREPVTFERLLTRECVVFVSAVCKREAIEAVGGYDETLGECEDFDLWLRMAQHGFRFAFTPEPLVRYRRRGGALSSDEVRMPRSLIKVYEKVLAGSHTTPRERELIAPRIAEMQAQLNRVLSKRLLAARDFAGAAHHLALANAHYRSAKLALVGAALRVAPWLVAKLMAWQQAGTR